MWGDAGYQGVEKQNRGWRHETEGGERWRRRANHPSGLRWNPFLYVKRHFGCQGPLQGLVQEHATGGDAAGAGQLGKGRAPLSGVTEEQCGQIRVDGDWMP